jgi:hypothetical protein
MGASAYWNPQSLSRPIMELLYIQIESLNFATKPDRFYMILHIILYNNVYIVTNIVREQG